MDEPEQPRASVAVGTMRPHKATALVEYALIVSLISALVFGPLALVGDSVHDVFVSVGTALARVAPNGGNGGGNGGNSGSNGNGGNQGNGNGGNQGNGNNP
jgi:Flp pilus assembly pilin Flp